MEGLCPCGHEPTGSIVPGVSEYIKMSVLSVGHVPGSCAKGELLRNSRHKVRSHISCLMQERVYIVNFFSQYIVLDKHANHYDGELEAIKTALQNILYRPHIKQEIVIL